MAKCFFKYNGIVVAEEFFGIPQDWRARSSKLSHRHRDYDILCLCEIKETYKSEFVERFPELSLFFKAYSLLDSEMICIFPYLCPYAESAREIFS